MSDCKSLCKPLLTKKEKELLMNGYVRRETGDFVPTVLVELVRLFYNNLRSLKIVNNNLDEFLYENQPMITEKFSINEEYKDIKFRMGVYPNGLRRNKQDAVEFYIKLKSLQQQLDKNTDITLHPQQQQNQIDRVKLYYQLFNQETQSEWKGVISMALNEYIVWPPYLMRLSQITKEKLNCLFFSADIKILSLCYNNGEHKQIAKPIYMNKNEQYVWNINDKQKLNRLYTAQYGYCIFSPNFGGSNDDNWCIKYYPEGIKDDDYRGAIFVRLLRKPMNIKKLKVRYKIASNDEDIVQEIKEFSHEKHSNGYWIRKLSLNTQQHLNKYGLQFKIYIDILEIFDYNDQCIPPQQWMKHGICRLKPF